MGVELRNFRRGVCTHPVESARGRQTRLTPMNTRLEFDLDLLRRYDRPGPRYTSYPSAPQFSTRFTDADFRRAGGAQQPGADSARSVAVRARAVLLLTVLLLRMQSNHHARREPRRAVRRTPGARSGDGGAAVRSRSRCRAAALRRRHAELPESAGSRGPGRQPRAVLPLLECANPRFFHRARSAQRPRWRHRGVRGHGIQSRKLRRAGFRPRGATGDQSRAEHRGDAARHRRLPHFRISLRQRGSHLWPAAPDSRGISAHAEYDRARAAGSRGGVRLCAHAADLQGAAADRRARIARRRRARSRCCSWRSSG